MNLKSHGLFKRENKSMKAILYVATSLNGMMTQGETNSDWVSEEDEKMFAEVCSGVGAILVGRQTFDQYQGIVYPVPETQNIVLTSQERVSDDPNVKYASNFDMALSLMEDSGIDRFIVVGGANIIGQCLQKGLVNTIYLSLHPFIFSNGLSMIGDFNGDMNLTFKGVKHQSTNFILLEYGVNNA